MDQENFDFNAIKWDEVIVGVETFARKLLKSKKWFRGDNTEIYLKGKELNDYVHDAIELFWKNKEKYNPHRGTLINFINYYFLRLLIHKDSIEDENKETKDTSLYFDNDEARSDYMESILPYVEAFFDEDVDFKKIMAELEEGVNHELIVEQIFLGRSGFGLKRREIIKEFGKTESEYDNGNRRLQTIINRITSKYNIRPIKL